MRSVRTFSLFAALVGLALFPGTVSAQTELAVDGGLGLPVSARYAAQGIAAGLRLGWRFAMPGAWETVELGFAYGHFSPSGSNATPDSIATYRGVAGLRLGLSGILQPGAFAHAGFGRVEGKIQTSANNQLTSNSDFSHTAFTWDAGVYLDLAPSRHISLGAHASYNQIVSTDTDRSFQWLDLGGQLSLFF